MQKISCVENIGSANPASDRRTLDYRRCVVLAIVGATPAESPSVGRILTNGYLDSVKLWLDDTLSGSEGMFVAFVNAIFLLGHVSIETFTDAASSSNTGGIDMLLHLLSNIANLPVTKTVVKNSGMGKAIGSIEKHSKCKGTPNEPAILERVLQVKDAWQASVKAKKPRDEVPVTEYASSSKRPVELSAPSPIAKRIKPEPEQKTTAFSSLLSKVRKPKAHDSSSTKTGDSISLKPKPVPNFDGTSAVSVNTNQSSVQADKKGKHLFGCPW